MNDKAQVARHKSQGSHGKTKSLSFRLLPFALCLGIACANAQSYPAKPVRLIVPLAPGGPSDILARSMAQKLTENLKQTVFVENRTGAGGTIGTDIAAKWTADG